MNEKFTVLTDEELMDLSGGNAKQAMEFGGAVASSAVAGATLGSFFPVAGTAGGALLGALYGTAAWAFAKSSKW